MKYMQYFWEMYPDAANRPQVADDFDETIVFCIPWGHQRVILDKCKGNPQKALFFVNQVVQNNWSRAVLLNFLDTDLYERQGKAITNFALTLPAIQSDLAQEITKDPYKFDFLTLTQSYNEKELKDALMDNIQKFLLELGNGFAFVGREYRIEIGSKTCVVRFKGSTSRSAVLQEIVCWRDISKWFKSPGKSRFSGEFLYPERLIQFDGIWLNETRLNPFLWAKHRTTIPRQGEWAKK